MTALNKDIVCDMIIVGGRYLAEEHKGSEI